MPTDERFPDAIAVERMASFFGVQSAGKFQLRGLGTFVLSRSEIYFERLLPRKAFHIPIDSIIGVETPLSFLGKTRFNPLLKVVFTNAQGQPDAIAWDIPNREGLKSQIESLIEKKKNG